MTEEAITGAEAQLHNEKPKRACIKTRRPRSAPAHIQRTAEQAADAVAATGGATAAAKDANPLACGHGKQHKQVQGDAKLLACGHGKQFGRNTDDEVTHGPCGRIVEESDKCEPHKLRLEWPEQS